MMVGTKADKAGKKQVAETLENYKVALSEIWEELPTFYVSSSETKEGKSEILGFIQDCIGK